jgi:hypothetical protein
VSVSLLTGKKCGILLKLGNRQSFPSYLVPFSVRAAACRTRVDDPWYDRGKGGSLDGCVSLSSTTLDSGFVVTDISFEFGK